MWDALGSTTLPCKSHTVGRFPSRRMAHDNFRHLGSYRQRDRKAAAGVCPSERRRGSCNKEIPRQAEEEAAAALPQAAKSTKKKRKLTPEGRKRIAEAVKRRWAVQKKAAAAAAKYPGFFQMKADGVSRPSRQLRVPQPLFTWLSPARTNGRRPSRY